MNAVTRSGTNEFHGAAFEYPPEQGDERSEFLRPHLATDLTKADDGLKRNQFGATLGGPVFFPRFTTARTRVFSSSPTRAQRCGERPSTPCQLCLPPRSVTVTFPLITNRALRDPFDERAVPGKSDSRFAISIPLSRPSPTIPAPRTSRATPSPTRRSNARRRSVAGPRRSTDHFHNRLSGRYWNVMPAAGLLDPSNYFEPRSARLEQHEYHHHRHSYRSAPTLTQSASCSGSTTPTAPRFRSSGQEPDGAGRENVQRRQAAVSLTVAGYFDTIEHRRHQQFYPQRVSVHRHGALDQGPPPDHFRRRNRPWHRRRRQ